MNVPLPPLKESKRKRLTTPVKRRNMRYKPAPKREELNCGLCDFSSVSNVEIIRHMKNSHTEPPLGNSNVMADCSRTRIWHPN